MNKILFVGNLESPYIEEVFELIIKSGKEVVVNYDTYKKLQYKITANKTLRGKVQIWSWNDNDDKNETRLCIRNQIFDLFPYLYPNAINSEKVKKLLNMSITHAKSYGYFRLGFGVQEELFDLYLSHIFKVDEVMYFDVLSSLQLLDPVGQLEYRKNSYEFLQFIDKEVLYLSDRKLLIKRYRMIRPIPFFEQFAAKFKYSNCISYLSIEE